MPLDSPLDYLGITVQYSQMYVKRDFLDTLKKKSKLEAVLLWGPRQVGKTTLLDQLDLKSRLFLDDLALRERAQKDPAFTLDNMLLPCLIDEAQYAPHLFSEIKLRIDQARRKNIKKSSSKNLKTAATLYYLTGSNRTLLDEKVKESLAGRCHLYNLHGLSVREILAHFPEQNIKQILLKGGMPELYTRFELTPQSFLNDYILSFIEKDIAYSSGISKLNEFQTVLRLLAARTGQYIHITEIAGAAGVDQKTVQQWIQTLERNLILHLVPPFSSNLSKRITKMKKLYFYDVGLCARLQGHSDENLLLNSPQSGSLFETLVFSEILKTKDNFLKDWQLFSWRTKEQNEIDFILQSQGKFIFIEAKLGIHGARSFSLDSEALKVFPHPHKKIVVTSSGENQKLDSSTEKISIANLGSYLLENL